jgi:hypothetical protein
MNVDRSILIDITADAYKRVAIEQRREGHLNDRDFAEVMDRVRTARGDARAEAARAAAE